MSKMLSLISALEKRMRKTERINLLTPGDGLTRKQKDQTEKYYGDESVKVEQMESDTRKIISVLIEKHNLLDEQIKAMKDQLSQLDKRDSTLFTIFKEGIEIVRQRQLEIDDRLTSGMKSHQEMRNKIDELSNANINLSEERLQTTEALGEKEGLIRSYMAEMETLMLDVRTRMDDFESNYQSFRKIEQAIESKIEQLASKVLEKENQRSDVNQMNILFGEKLSSVAKTLDEKDSIFRAYQKETEDLIQALTRKIDEIGLHSEHFQKEIQEVSFQKNTINYTIAGIHEAINSLKNDFTHKVNSYNSEILNQVSALRTKLDDQNLVNHQLEEKGRNIELQLKDINDTWEKLHEQQSTKYGELLGVMDEVKSRMQRMEEKLMSIKEAEGGVQKLAQDLLGKFSIVQRDIESVKQEVSMKKHKLRVVENKLDMIKKVINETEMEHEE